ncbi:MAG: hypothetical protein ACKPJJ_34070 [Planctomycetaceae bacterium]
MNWLNCSVIDLLSGGFLLRSVVLAADFCCFLPAECSLGRGVLRHELSAFGAVAGVSDLRVLVQFGQHCG